MGKKETKSGKKKFIHKRGFIDKGILYKGQVYPVFSMKQDGRSWNLLNSLKSKNITKKDLETLKGLLSNASTIREREEAYIRFNKEKGIPEEVSIKALELSNNRLSEKFITSNNDDFEDFNKIVRGEAFIKVNKGEQETAPKVEEVSGQGLKKEKVIKPSKVEEPDDDDDKELEQAVDKYLEEVEKIGRENKGGVRGKESLQNYSSILYKKYFNDFDDNDVAIEINKRRKLKPKQETKEEKKLRNEAMKEAIKETPAEPKGERDSFGKGDPSKPNIKMEINEIPPTPPPPTDETPEEITEQIQERLMEQEGTAGFSPVTSDESGLDLDNNEDTGIHNEAIQRIATMNNYDYTFTRTALFSLNPLPDDVNLLKKMGEKTLREYGFLLGILEPKDKFSKKEVEELKTLEHILKQVIRLEVQYKKALLKMRVSSVATGNNQLENLMNQGQLGLVLNAGSVNISPQEAVEKMSKSSLLPEEPKAEEPKQEQAKTKPPVDVFQELGEKKIKGKGNKKKERKRRLLSMGFQDKRKAMLREPKNIVLRGRIQEPVLYQNLRSEAERLNENPIPIVFKSNPNMNRMRRFNVSY